MKKDKPIVIIRDSKDQRNIVVSTNLKQGTTTVFSGFSAWENLALLLEALAVTAEKCTQEGIEKDKVYGAIKDYLIKVFGNYKIKEKH